MVQNVEPNVLSNLSQEIDEYFAADTDQKTADRNKTAKRIQLIMRGLARKLAVQGDVKMFGSWSNGFKSGSSDLDVVFCSPVEKEMVIPHLGRFAAMVPECGFENVTKIFQANVPLVKFTDGKTGMEVDFCINNELGVRNSTLLQTYCALDERVVRLGRMVKEWAKRHELVGTADGCLNSYAYMLLVIHYLQGSSPPVVPNLQLSATDSVRITDSKWGCEDSW